ncbi:cardiolipin synthase [Fictibacillus sp. Mic-4]|uniref:cardiolipin synthase n=1 Tax=Fictibacillus TaxID=1329200 RepID=UPI00041A7C44|nr:cardiolipin synthase [Fictibacillus gelatini]
MVTLKRIFLTLIIISVLIGSIFLYYEIYDNPIFSILSIISALFVAVIIFFENRHPSSTIAWLILLAILPFVGFIIYLLIGQNYRKKRKFNRKALADEEAFTRIVGNKELILSKMSEMGDHQHLFFKLAQKLGKSPISFSTESKILTNGEEKFSLLLKALRNAKEHIHLEYYIVRDDGIGKEIKDILIQKVKEGVEVRFLYDAVGSLRLSREYVAELRREGVQMVPFFPVRLPFFNQKINFRNHRKIVVVDGDIGFVGGLNIGDEYLGKNPSFGHWRDTHLFIKGEAVRSLQLIFVRDWYHMTGETLLTPKYLSPTPTDENHGGVQMVAGGPDSEWEVIKNLYFSMIISAKKTIWIASPYFIPDPEISTALKIAALSGLDVRILVPNKPDKRTVFFASRSYFPDLLRAGVKVYEYTKGFMHSKIVIVDNELASIGTCNMDMRSFHLNFEVNAFLFRTKSTLKLVEDYKKDIEDSKELTLDDFNNRKLKYRVLESLSRLLSPLL